NEVIEFEMEVENKMYPVESVTDYDRYTNLKLPEKEIKKEAEANVCQNKEKATSVRVAATSLNINRATGNGRPVYRPPTLTDEHKDFMIEWTDENTDPVILDDMLEVLTEKLGGFDISKNRI
ncbi:hypothetical protein CU098_002298, partial [Rhizopus stolonifer]